jgi:hypothetical protein
VHLTSPILSWYETDTILVAFVWELTKETIDLPLGCLQGGERKKHGLEGQGQILELESVTLSV